MLSTEKLLEISDYKNPRNLRNCSNMRTLEGFGSYPRIILQFLCHEISFTVSGKKKEKNDSSIVRSIHRSINRTKKLVFKFQISIGQGWGGKTNRFNVTVCGKKNEKNDDAATSFSLFFFATDGRSRHEDQFCPKIVKIEATLKG